MNLPRLFRFRFVRLPLALALAGCGHLRHHAGSGNQYVYVQSRGTFLRDRLAVVSNHVADIHNGDRLLVLQHTKRFYQVRTAAGREGWLEEHAVVDQGQFDKFEALKRDKSPAVAAAVLRDDIFLHLTPGRKTDHFYLLPAGDRLQLLRRASVPKVLQAGAVFAPPKPRVRRVAPVVKKVESGSTVFAQAPPHPDRTAAPDLDPQAAWMAQPMEDWWLVRDGAGKVGWVLARGFDVDVPDEVAQYSEGRRMVAAYLLSTVEDNGEPPVRHIGPEEARKLAERAARAAAARRRHPEAAAPEVEAKPVPVPHAVGQYVTVTSEFRDGLPYDWDQVRVFIWNAKKHRYETAYRLREQQGYLPVTLGREPVDKFGEEPTFTIRTSPDGVVSQDAEGAFHPATVNVTQYRLEGGIVRRDTPLPSEPGEAAGAGEAAGHTAPRKAASFRGRSGKRRR